MFEDAVAGIQAAKNAGMTAVGIGTPEVLPDADLHLPSLDSVTIEAVERALS